MWAEELSWTLDTELSDNCGEECKRWRQNKSNTRQLNKSNINQIKEEKRDCVWSQLLENYIRKS